MKPQPLPQHRHDLALLLVESLTSQQQLGESLVEGTLPSEFDFKEVDQALLDHHIDGLCDEASRHIEFHPEWADVYPSLDVLLNYPEKRILVPEKFTILDVGYTHGISPTEPPLITQYLQACRLHQLLSSVADMVNDGQQKLIFIQSHDSKIEVNLQYSTSQLSELKGLTEFANNFVESDQHRNQKRTIIRSVLLEMFKGKKNITIGQLLNEFSEFMERLRSSYSMYVAEFSFEKVKAEVEKDNLDSTLKLNKTFSDIQNQLLALPVALILVGGQMNQSDGLAIKNLVVWLGSAVFSFLMWMLIHNQRNAVKSIGYEIQLRKQKIDTQSSDIAQKFKVSFEELGKRQVEQDHLLRNIEWVIDLSLAFSTVLLLWYSFRDQIQALRALLWHLV